MLLKVIGTSLDEATFYRSVLNRETVSNSLIMIQPTLESYSFNGPPVPVLLSSESIVPDKILLLDTFFTVRQIWFWFCG
jgi:protein transport protein SEC23